MMVAANACQLVLMIVFLALLLARLKETFVASWFFVFVPLWISDAITFVAGTIEMRRLLRARADSPYPTCASAASAAPRLPCRRLVSARPRFPFVTPTAGATS